ncbi:MAG: bifunctional 5,10-methylenetetrahydrofolate dehydrogenase/5,10-methenyltetrahydrofolate cyclohydrolase [Clostridiales bacterium]|nr:bifunctional 5,10-methylenetetrahydrofolate dehydrogenase/5,10-methenyltetrahydrofolate cyclohydrolase [Clostridiales bacterium]
MAEILRGKPVADRINENSVAQVKELGRSGIVPTLAILRVGERADDISYERGAMKRCAAVGVAVRNVILAEDVSQNTLMRELDQLNRDEQVHGIMVFRPLPKHLDEEAVRQAMDPAKDVDGITDGSLAGVFTNTSAGFCPCTAQAAVEILDFYGVECSGKRAAVIGRSLVVGRPAAMLLMHRNATVTICHTRTVDMPSVIKEADIVIVCAGKMETIDAKYFRPGQTVIDVGIGFNEEKGKLCGDVDYDAVEPIVDAITPVPGGVGSVTTAVLVKHVVEAARRAAEA